MANYVVGDIQGCYKPLRKLLKKIKFSSATDTLWCAGDLVNRGPKSLETLRFISDLGDRARIVLGNHDLHFIAKYEGCGPRVSQDTLAKLLAAPDCGELCDWLRFQPLAQYHAVDGADGVETFLMIHAGVCPLWSLQKTLNLAAEVELALQSPEYREFLKSMYGNRPARWHDKLQGQDRLRVITNYLTRVRFCDPIGSMRLTIKEGLSAAPPGCKPWFEYEKVSRKAHILFGHWAALQGVTNRPRVHALDTGCVWGRELTAMRLEDLKRYSY
jgi:bis(5'-nucleosyl)-tetraphosphatase (symmetrical)